MMKKKKKLSKKMLVPAAIMRSFVMGFKGSITNLFIIDIAASFGLTTAELGGMIASNYISGVIVPFIAGRASDLLGKKKVTIISIIIAILGAIMVATAQTVMVYIVGTVILGIGNSASNGAITPAMADMYPEKATRYISLLHVFVSVATMIGPVTLTWLNTSFGVSWRMALAAISVLTVIPLVMISMSDIREPKGAKTARGIKEMFALLRDPALLAGTLAIMFYCATDNVYTSFLSIFYNGKFGSIVYGSYALSLHGAMYAIARYLVGYVKSNIKLLGVVTLTISTITLILVPNIKSPAGAVVCCALYSLSFAPLYSLIISQTALAYPGNSGMATSLMFLGGGIGGLIFSSVTTQAQSGGNVNVIFYIMAGTCTVALLFFLFYMNRLSKKENLTEEME